MPFHFLTSARAFRRCGNGRVTKVYASRQRPATAGFQCRRIPASPAALRVRAAFSDCGKHHKPRADAQRRQCLSLPTFATCARRVCENTATQRPKTSTCLDHRAGTACRAPTNRSIKFFTQTLIARASATTAPASAPLSRGLRVGRQPEVAAAGEDARATKRNPAKASSSRQYALIE